MVADAGVLLLGHARLLRGGVRRLGLGLPPRDVRSGVPRRRADHRSVGRRRRAGGDADQRRHVRRHARPPLSDRRELDLDLVRRLGGLAHLGDLRRAEAAPLRRADRRRLRRHALRQRGRADAGRRRSSSSPTRSCSPRSSRRSARSRPPCSACARWCAMAALLASTGFYTRARRRARELVHRVHPDADHGAGARLRACRSSCRTSAGSTALGEYVGSIEPRVTGWWFSWQRTARVRPVVRPRHRRRALRDDALLLDARRRARCATPSASRCCCR